MTDTFLQRDVALEKANHVRITNARTLHDIRFGVRRLRAVLDDECLQRAPIARLLRAQPKWGQVRTQHALRALGVTRYDTRLGELTERQRKILLGLIP